MQLIQLLIKRLFLLDILTPALAGLILLTLVFLRNGFYDLNSSPASPASVGVNPQAPVAQKSADELIFRHFEGEGVEFFYIGPH